MKRDYKKIYKKKLRENILEVCKAVGGKSILSQKLGRSKNYITVMLSRDTITTYENILRQIKKWVKSIKDKKNNE